MSDTAYTAAVITVSDKGFRGEREDTSGPALCEMLRAQGWQVIHTAVVPDEKDMICRELTDCADRRQAALVLTTGGTGFSPRDITPEATIAVCDRMATGIAEAIRTYSLQITPRAMLSRQTSGIRKKTLIINLPGSPKACREDLDFILPSLGHGLGVLCGTDGECGTDAGETPHSHEHHHHGE